MTTVERHIFAQRLFLTMGFTFLAFLLISIFLRSSGRRPLFSSSASEFQTDGEVDQSAVTIQDFHRVETKNGLPSWEVRAAEARFPSSTGISNLSEMSLVVYRPDGSKIHLDSDSSRLTVVDGAISKVELAGNIKVRLEDDTTILTDSAVYVADLEEVRSVAEVEIFGNGFLIQGRGLVADLKDRYIRLEHDVRSKFISSLLKKASFAAVEGIAKGQSK